MIRSINNSGIAAALFAIIVFVSACQPGPSTNSGPSNVTSNSNVAPISNSAPAADPNAASMDIPVTLPVLDAVLTDEAFAGRVKSELQLSDEELQNIRDAARNAVIELGQSTIEDDSRSTRDSVEKAKAAMREVIGAEKSERLLTLVRQHWGGSDGSSLAGAPSAVPTDTRIVVNAPAYRMDIFENGQLKASYKVGIGYPEFPLPVGLRKAETIIFNPTWTPPDEPWVKGKVQPGKKVDAGSKLNPLGPIKIPIGLPSLIHGGKSPDRLGTFASHGCVGLTSPQIQEFAMVIANLSGKPLTLDEIKGYEKEKTKTVDLDLSAPIPVELRYETIVVEDGKLKIYRDVYERGTNTEENLRRVLQAFGVDLNSLPDRDKILDGLEAMAVDALGKPVDAETAASNGNANNPKNESGKVTRNIKGKKEMVFEIAALAGKGYPAAMEKAAAAK
jgi:lipoprotein-anchoring transpeptidase ErfK/SrfK